MQSTAHTARSTLFALASAAVLASGACRSTATKHAMPQEHHTIDYIELTVRDLAEARRFYGQAFGWAFNDYGPDYAGIQRTGGGEVGGLRQDVQAAPTAGGVPLVILYSKDLEATVRAVRDAGGRIEEEPFAFPGGRRFHFRDPSGNELAVWSEGSGE